MKNGGSLRRSDFNYIWNLPYGLPVLKSYIFNTLYQPWLNLVKGPAGETMSKFYNDDNANNQKKDNLAEKLQVVARVSYKQWR